MIRAIALTVLSFTMTAVSLRGQAIVPIGDACATTPHTPGCTIAETFGPGGLTVAVNPKFNHEAHFAGSFDVLFVQTLNTAIATQLTALPTISPASGFTWAYDPATGAEVPEYRSFGPIFTERAETTGRGKVSFGASQQRFRFSSIDGINLHSFPAVFRHCDTANVCQVGTTEPAYENDFINTNNNLVLNFDETTAYGTLGLTDHLDVSVLMPFLSVRENITSAATIEHVGTYVPFPGSPPVNVHSFCQNFTTPCINKTFTNGGTSSGIGDLTFRLKQGLITDGPVRVAAALDVRTPTGSTRDLLGSGAWGVKPFLIVSVPKRISPHLNIGYEWNGRSLLAGDIAGQNIGSNFPIPSKGKLPNQFIYSIGVDTAINKRLSASIDYLGLTLIDAPRVFQSSYETPGNPLYNVAGGAYPTISGGKDTIATSTGSAGVKYKLYGNVLLTANVLFRMDDIGLRQNFTPLLGLSYAH